MRGRTNVGGGGLAINANPVNKTIKSGTIIAGDFVEYYTDEQIVEQSDYVLFIFNKGDYTIALKSGKLALFKNNEQVDLYTDYNFSRVVQVCSYGNYILFLPDTSSSNGVIGVLSINTQTDSFSVVNIESIQFEKSSLNNFSIAAGNGKILVAAFYSSQNYYNFVTADIDSNGQISNVVSSYPTGNTKQSGSILEYYNNKFYQIYGPSSTTTSLVPLTIGSDGKVTYDNFGTSLLSYQKIQRKIYQDGKIVVYACNPTSASSQDYKIAVVDLVGVTASFLSVNGNCISEIINGKLICAKFDTSSSRPSAVYLYSYNYNTKEVELLNTLQVDLISFGMSYGGICNLGNLINNSIILCKRRNSDRNVYEYKKLNLVGNSIEDIPDVDYVIPYTDGGHPIGVAKDPGTTGSVIGVYIPVPVE